MWIEAVGLLLMAILVALSNAGGLSGAGSNIPLMLIFFGMNMSEAVPISACVAVSATVFRFVKNFDERHPQDESRCCINYDIVEVTMPLVFLGSLLGVQLGKLLGHDLQMATFAVVVSWSIYTSFKKWKMLVEKEICFSSSPHQLENKQTALLEHAGSTEEKGVEEPHVSAHGTAFREVHDSQRECDIVLHSERHHFPSGRVAMISCSFCCLLATQMIWKSEFGNLVRYSTLCSFGIIVIVMTFWTTRKVQRAHIIKKAMGRGSEDGDITFATIHEAVRIAVVCMIAAIFCGCTGIAGGMVLGPLFMSYGMNPQVMSATNQYITMISSLAVMLQFAALHDIEWWYAGIFALTSVVSAYLGIRMVKWYIAHSGKESIIALLLVVVLVFALISLPVKVIIDG